MSSSDHRDHPPEGPAEDLEELRGLPRQLTPPAELEERVVAALRDERLVGDPTDGSRPWLRWAAAVLLAAVGGWSARGWVADRPVAPEPAPRYSNEYLILFAEPNGLATDKPVPELAGEYRAWAQGLDAERMVAGRRLARSGRLLTTDSSGAPLISTEGPWSETTGFFLIRADSWEEAIELAGASPHLAYGGEIRLREVARGG